MENFMTNSNQVPQVDLKQLVALATSTGLGLSILALVLVFVGFLLPFVSVSTNIGMGLDQTGSMGGFAAAGWAAWLTVLAFIAVILSWKVIQIAPYRTVLSYAGAALAIVTVVVGCFFNPVTSEMSQLNAALPGTNMISLGPHIGMLAALIAGGLLVWAAGKPA
jgi:hypothetical protein